MSAALHRVRFWSDHRWAQARMSDHLDQDLRYARRRRMERHVDECEDCRRLLADLRAMVALLRRMRTPDDGVDAARIAASVRLALE
jgi:anti-sigma factor RsiW